MSFASNIAHATLTGWTLPSTAAFVSSVAAANVMGALWYSDVLFASYWIKLAYPDVKDQKDFEDHIKNTGYHPSDCYNAAMAGTASGFFLLRGFLRNDGINTTLDGVLVAVMLSSVNGLFGMMHSFFENRPWQLCALNHGYHLVCFAMAGAIIASFD